MTDAIAAAAMRCKTMSDGSLRIEVEVEPNDAQSAFALFGRPGARMAIAALKDGYGAKSDKQPVAVSVEKPYSSETHRLTSELGPLAFDAVRLDKNPQFKAYAVALGYESCREMILKRCGVTSRRDLDGSEEAASFWHGLMRDFNSWKRSQ